VECSPFFSVFVFNMLWGAIIVSTSEFFMSKKWTTYPASVIKSCLLSQHRLPSFLNFPLFLPTSLSSCLPPLSCFPPSSLFPLPIRSFLSPLQSILLLFFIYFSPFRTFAVLALKDGTKKFENVEMKEVGKTKEKKGSKEVGRMLK
jgi:hypothetical protein